MYDAGGGVAIAASGGKLMRVDMAEEFNGIDAADDLSDFDMKQFVLQKMLDACVSAVTRVCDWCYADAAIGVVLEDLPQDSLESFLALATITQLADRQRMRAGNEVNIAYIKKKAGM